MAEELRNWAADLAAFASETTANLPGGPGDYIGTSGGILSYKGVPIPGNEFEVIILDWTNANLRYEGVYDAANPASPVCYAFGTDKTGMKPHADSPTPQCSDCKSCPLNQFGSADVGKGKACQNTLRLALVPVGALENLLEEEVAYMKIPVTSVKNFTTLATIYAQTLKRPPFAMSTFVKGEPGSPMHLLFRAGSPVPDDKIGVILEKRQMIDVAIPFPYVEPAPKPTKPNRFTRK